MSKALVNIIYNIQKKANKAAYGKHDYRARERAADSKALQKAMEYLGHTHTYNKIENVVNNLCTELDKGDNAINMMNVQNLCATAVQNI